MEPEWGAAIRRRAAASITRARSVLGSNPARTMPAPGCSTIFAASTAVEAFSAIPTVLSGYLCFII